MSTVGALDLFRIGIGPSSSHTVGPMRAASRFARDLPRHRNLWRITVELFGSLAATGVGHGTIPAVVLGLTGAQPDAVDPDTISDTIATVTATQRLLIAGGPEIGFTIDTDITLSPHTLLPGHPNGIRLTAHYTNDHAPITAEFFSIGGGFVATATELDNPIRGTPTELVVPYPFDTADELVRICTTGGLSIASVARANEIARHPETNISDALATIWATMRDCVDRGCTTVGTLPGGLGVQRRAATLQQRLNASTAGDAHLDPLTALDWVNLWALAVNEENAAGGRVVTAPTNGAAGIIPAVLHYYWRFVPGASSDGVAEFLLTAGAIGSLFKMNASISGAEVGCQGEVGSACAMAAAGLTEVLGGTPSQVENAAEIGLEHNLGLTCDPIGGLVQIPCIERNAMAATKAINAARLALCGDGTHFVSLDAAIETLRETGRDMLDSYKETARGGLAATFQRRGPTLAAVPVTVVDC